MATGTVVFFNFHSTLLRHQILSIPSPQFASSALIEPASLTPVHAVRFPDAGTYQYRDAFDPGILGSIIVQ